MAIKKSQLYSSIWKGCDELRGPMDPSTYKDYVLVLLFVRYVSDKYAGKKNTEVTVPEGGSFADLVALKGKINIGEGINVALGKLADANGLDGIFDNADFNDPEKLGTGKDMVDRLSKLVAIFENSELDFSRNRAEGDDLLGDAYEFLMKHFAVESGKSKGQFYTPAEVSRIIARVIGAQDAKGAIQTVYDPACGSGSLLLKIAAETSRGISIYGQELDNATANLATLNMWLHNQPGSVIKKGHSTLSNPLFVENSALKTFDYVVANPPFSYKAWRTGFNPEDDLFDRFTDFGVPPAKNGDFAFLLHIVKSMKSTGKGAVILPHGVLFRGNGESLIRSNLIKRGLIKSIIGLPANLFYGTGIPACIIVLDKASAANRKGIFMVDASKGFIKEGNKNRLRESDMKKIINVFEDQLEIPKYSQFVTTEEIQANDYNLNIPRYIDTSDPEDLQDIEAHLKGGIPNVDIEALNEYWGVFPSLRQTIFKPSKRKGYSELTISTNSINEKILANKDFEVFRTNVLGTVDSWGNKSVNKLKNISTKDHPKAIIQEIADSLLATCENLSLIDKYDIYQYLMTYWGETMQDDVYIITVDGWDAGNQVSRLQRDSKDKKKEIEGLVGLEGRLIPVSLLINTYFQTEKRDLDALKIKLDEINARMEELKDENSDEEGLLAEVTNEKDKISKSSLQKRFKEIKDDKQFADEFVVLKDYLKLFDQESEIKQKIKTIEKDLERKVLTKYPELSLKEIKMLVVEQKWTSELMTAISGEVNKRSQLLADRILELAERYAIPMPVIESKLKDLSVNVEHHLKKMGFVW